MKIISSKTTDNASGNIFDKRFSKVIDYKEILARLYPNESNATIAVSMQITDACNLNCSYCYQINKSNHVMSLETAKQFIDLLLDENQIKKYVTDYDNIRGIALDFIGGEPLLYASLISDIIDYFDQQLILLNHKWQYNRRFSICSNGTLYFNEDVQKLFQKYHQDIAFNITIDGNKELHDTCRKFPNGEGSYDLAKAALDHYRNTYNSPMSTKITIAPQNVNQIYNAIIHMIDLGYTSIHLNCVFEKGWEITHAQELYKQLKNIANYLIANNLTNIVDISLFKPELYGPMSSTDSSNWCGGNGKMIAVDYKGDLYPCIRYMESSLGPNVKPIIIGNIKDGFMPNQACQECVKLLQSVNRLNQSTEECINCPVAGGCAWCQAYNYQDSGDFFHRATYICWMHKAVSLANVYYWNLYFFDNNISDEFRVELFLPDEDALKIVSEEELKFLKTLTER